MKSVAMNTTKYIGAAFVRVALIFTFLVIATDSMSRLYYTYMPISTWMDFRSVEVLQEGDRAVVRIERYPKEDRMVLVRRVLSILAPVKEKACGSTVQGVVNESEGGFVQTPLSSDVEGDCSSLFQGRAVDTRLQISYVFEFPFGIQRIVTRWSYPFRLTQPNGHFSVSPLPEDH